MHIKITKMQNPLISHFHTSKMKRSSVNSLVVFITVFRLTFADVSHFFTPDFNYLQHHHHHHLIPQQQQQQQQLQQPQPQPIPIAFQPPVPGLYGPPPPPGPVGGYPYPVPPSPAITPSPVAPVSSSTTEFILPEIVENRSAKDERQFILRQKQYLPPLEDRPNYESPTAGDQQYPFAGYNYNKPTTTSTSTSRPIIVDDPTSEFGPPINANPIFIPPINNDELARPPFAAPPSQGYDYNVPASMKPPQQHKPVFRPSTPAPVYLPGAPAAEQAEETIVQNSDPSLPPLKLRIHEMRCLQQQTPQGGYFRSVLKVDSFIGATPTVDNDSTDKRCELKLHKSFVVVDLAGENFATCGVQQCGEDLCLRLRFPAVRGLRTSSDSILTLHCKAQNRVAVKVHALKMGVVSDMQSRSIGTYAKGGSQNSFRTHVELLRKTSQGFVQLLSNNEAVQLGEDLLLRAHVLTGDGWNYTKLTDVSLQRISPSGEVLNNAILITPQGCLSPSMRGICTQAPSYDPPLGYKLPFKAVMFQGMRSGEELIMSMRITGCLDYNDCQVLQEQCPAVSNLRRRKRDSNDSQTNSNEISEISKISFKVVIPEETKTKVEDSNPVMKGFQLQSKYLILLTSLGFVALLLALALFAAIKLRK